MKHLTKYLTTFCFVMMGLIVGSNGYSPDASACPMRTFSLGKQNNKQKRHKNRSVVSSRQLLVLADKEFKHKNYRQAYSKYNMARRGIPKRLRIDALKNMTISAIKLRDDSKMIKASRLLIRADSQNAFAYQTLASGLEKRSDEASKQERNWALNKLKKLQKIDTKTTSQVMVATKI